MVRVVRVVRMAEDGGQVDVGVPQRARGRLGWLWEELGLDVEIFDDAYGEGLHGLVGLALRRNRLRAHLLVSRVLGKHLPVDPVRALGVGALLAEKVRARLAGRLGNLDPPLVIGYCETATALGHIVADGLPGADYLHTTRRRVAAVPPLSTFVEAHSHATHHWLAPTQPGLVQRDRPLVLVDDELSTGNTVLGTIRTLHAYAPRPLYIVAALFDARPAVARAAFDDLADDLDVPVDVVSLLSGTVRVPPDIAERARCLRGSLAAAEDGGSEGEQPGGTSHPAGGEVEAGAAAGFPVRHLDIAWPAGLPDGARHGWGPAASALLGETLPGMAARLAHALRRPDGHTLVLGTEELMYTPMRIAAALGDAVGRHIVYQSTTRSPVHPVDVAGYAIRTAMTFPAPDEPARASHLYNVRPGSYDEIVVVVDSAAGAGTGAGTGTGTGSPGGTDPSGLARALRRCAPVTVVTVPSYVPAVAR